MLDRCTDGTRAAARGRRRRDRRGRPHRRRPAAGVGAARRHGMDLACARLPDAGNPDGLIVSTDADTSPAEDWLAEQLALAARGRRGDRRRHRCSTATRRTASPPATIARRERARPGAPATPSCARDPAAEHHFFSGASMAVTARAYRRGRRARAAARARGRGVRGAPRTRRRPDHPLGGRARRDRRRGPTAAPRAASPATSSSASGSRAAATTGAPSAPRELRERKGGTTVSVVLPARDCAETVGGVLATAVDAVRRGRARRPGRRRRRRVARRAPPSVPRRAGAEVHAEDDLLPAFGPALRQGRRDVAGAVRRRTATSSSSWTPTRTTPTRRTCSASSARCSATRRVHFVKAAFERPFRTRDGVIAHEGGRVTELMARPLLNLHFPALAGFAQPLAGETAARRELLRAVPFAAGYGVEIGLLIDALRARRPRRARRGARRHAPEPPPVAARRSARWRSRSWPPSSAVSRATARTRRWPQGLVQPWDDGAVRDVPVEERPPMREVVGSADAATAR